MPIPSTPGLSPHPAISFDVVVIGAGAAGMMCAATAGQRGRRVLLVDHYPKLGEKIRISGGGRCNFTNLHASPAEYLSKNPPFCRSALARYTPRHFIALVEKHRIAYHEKTLGQLFCDESATQIIDLLKAECDAGSVEWRMPCEVRGVEREGVRFRVDTAAGAVLASSLVIATGGLTVPKIGATPFGYKVAQQFGLAVVPPKPALVPLSLDPETLARYGDLSGVSADAEVSCRGARFRESLLFTHRGLSGPAILQVSSYWQDGSAADPLHVNLLPGTDIVSWLGESRRSKAHLATRLGERLPKRFAVAWCEAHDLAKPIAELSDKALAEAAEMLGDWPVRPSGTLGYNKAEVTLGGVDTRDLSSKTMEATSVPGLHFIGEVVDVTGHLGGFNFQWAWASGHAAGEAA
ncbi:MAG: NAD(P)/FAD-dependent oxidoreductase [Betaproteobacteria bacterium]|nr:NAD(P)/FAD-dependent oxidoreductase [Betaproteobacteria bacterium]